MRAPVEAEVEAVPAADRVESLGALESPAGGETRLRADIPLAGG